MPSPKKTSPEYPESLEIVRKLLKPGDTLYCIIRSVARGGMSRRIDYYCKEEGTDNMRWLTPFMVQLGVSDESYASWYKQGDYAGARINGCGMDMCFESAYRLGRHLWPEGFCYNSKGIRPSDGKTVEVNAFRGIKEHKEHPEMPRDKLAEYVAKGWKFPGGRNGDASGWETDGGYALKYRTL